LVDAAPPKYEDNFASNLKKDGWVLNPEDRFNVSKDQTLRENIVSVFYPSDENK
jgi:hypothetical protein